jgi:integrase
MTLKYLIRDRDRHGVERIYLRRKGHPKIRIAAPEGTEAFLAEYNRALLGTRSAAPDNAIKCGSLRWLVSQYVSTSAQFLSLNPATRKLMRAHLEAVCVNHGENPIASLRTKHLQSIVDAMVQTPFAANNRIKALRALFKWAHKKELIATNPAKDLERLKTPKGGHQPWTAADVRKYLQRHPLDTMAGLALAIFFFTGVRRSDAAKLGRQMESEDGAWLRWRETKGGEVKLTEIPIEPEFRAILDYHRAADRLHYLVTAFGKPFTPAGFGNWFRDRCDEAGLSGLSAHGVRKAGATIAADEGASSHELLAFFNWSSIKETDTYTRAANRKRLAARTSKLLSLENIAGSKVSNLTRK